ncbi:MAG: hypothetical protein SXG53_13165 [Pseudomonadota bacterium]|nr:hypothetical protein [Pseudomonadota bacterium]
MAAAQWTETTGKPVPSNPSACAEAHRCRFDHCLNNQLPSDGNQRRQQQRNGPECMADRVLSAIPAGTTAAAAGNHTSASVGRLCSKQKGFFNCLPVLHNPRNDFAR